MSNEATTAPGQVDDAADNPIAAAMVLLAEAEVVAGAIRAQADHYARQREAEADLLVQKARRVLVAAQAKAEVIVATARAKADPSGPTTLDLDALAADRSPSADSQESDLDRLLEAAIGRALDNALLPDLPA